MSEPVFICDKLTMKVVGVYDSVTECAEGEGLLRTKVADVVRFNRVIGGKYVYRLKCKYDPNESFEGRHHRPIKVENVVTGKIMYFHDVDDICETLGKTRESIVNNNIKRGYLVGKCLKITWAR